MDKYGKEYFEGSGGGNGGDFDDFREDKFSRKSLNKQRNQQRKRFTSFDDEDQQFAMNKFTNVNFDGKLTFYEYIWISLLNELNDSDYNFNYYEEVGKACEKFGQGENLNIMEQILVYMSGQEEEVGSKYPDMKKHQHYQHFWNTIDKWINITDSKN